MTTIKTVDGLTYFTTQSASDILAALAGEIPPAWIELQPSGTLLSLIHVTAIEPDNSPNREIRKRPVTAGFSGTWCDCGAHEKGQPHRPDCPVVNYVGVTPSCTCEVGMHTTTCPNR